jgi:hypothetical protein
MEEPADDASRRADSFSVAPSRQTDEPQPLTRSDLAPATLEAVELVARGFDLTRGNSTIELRFADGLFEVGFLHRRVTLKQLAEFEPRVLPPQASTHRGTPGPASRPAGDAHTTRA